MDGCILAGRLAGEKWDKYLDQQRRVYDPKGLCPTLVTSVGGHHIAKILERSNEMGKERTRIRRLTPLECWRLQAFEDEDFEKASKVCSDTQLYKQAGNSIAVDVLVNGILKPLLLDEPPKQMTIQEIIAAQDGGD